MTRSGVSDFNTKYVTVNGVRYYVSDGNGGYEQSTYGA
jgi:hypothetical protein